MSRPLVTFIKTFKLVLTLFHTIISVDNMKLEYKACELDEYLQYIV